MILLLSFFSTVALCLAADSSDTQFAWIRTLASCGVEITASPEEEDTHLRSATSIFHFYADDIDGRKICLDRYQ